MMRAPRLVASMALLPLLAAACGGGGGKSAANCAARYGVKGSVVDTGTKEVAGSTAAVEATDSKFGPTCTTGISKGTVTLTVTNRGALLHNVSIPAQSIDQDVQPGQTITVQADVGDQPVGYFCKYHRSSGMVGVLVPAP